MLKLNKKKALTVYLSGIVFICFACSQPVKLSNSHSNSFETSVNNSQEECNWCGTSEVPKDVSSYTIIAPKDELGQKLIISGTVYLNDKTTPAKDIIVYIYHTNAEGVYPKKGNELGNGKYHGYLRGWVKTDLNGKYQFETIRPAPYKTHGGEPAHIHYNIEGPDHPEYWLTALWFDDDPSVTSEQILNVKRNGGFSNITILKEDSNGVLMGTRDIALENYND